MRIEDADVLADELEETELELFDARQAHDEEVRLCKVLTDELVSAAAENECLQVVLGYRTRRLKEARKRIVDLHEEIGLESLRAKKRGRWIGVVLGAAFLLGSYFGFILGCA